VTGVTRLFLHVGDDVFDQCNITAIFYTCCMSFLEDVTPTSKTGIWRNIYRLERDGERIEYGTVFSYIHTYNYIIIYINCTLCLFIYMGDLLDL
jgi:hypothetical protein